MFNQNGLSLDQAPPFSVVLRFFFSGGLFGVLASILILFFGTDIFDASSYKALIVTHSFTLGVCDALFYVWSFVSDASCYRWSKVK